MGLFDMLFGRKRDPEPQSEPVRFGDGPLRLDGANHAADGMHQADAPEAALERYRHLLQTAPPETLEQVHAEIFSRLSPEERAHILQALSAELPPEERNSAWEAAHDPQSLARLAVRVELRRRGTLERVLSNLPSRQPGAMGMGGGMGDLAGTLMMSLALGLVGSMVAEQFFAEMGDPMAAVEEALPELPDAPFDAEEGFLAYDGGDDLF